MIKKTKNDVFTSIWHPSQWKKDLKNAQLEEKQGASTSTDVKIQKFVEDIEDYSDIGDAFAEKIHSETVPIPKKNIFSETDLIVFKDEYSGKLPINGILESQFTKAYELLKNILKGATKINYFSEKPKFIDKISQFLIILLTRKTGREVLDQIANGLYPTFIREGIEPESIHKKLSRGYEHIITLCTHPLDFSSQSATGEKIRIPALPVVSLFHEQLHVLNKQQGTSFSPAAAIQRKYGTEEEQVVISGLKNDFKELAQNFESESEIEAFSDEVPTTTLKNESDYYSPINEQDFSGKLGFPFRFDHGGTLDPYFFDYNSMSERDKDGIVLHLMENNFFIDLEKMIEQGHLDLDKPLGATGKSLKGFAAIFKDERLQSIVDRFSSN